jgi:GH18 family chitinase
MNYVIRDARNANPDIKILVTLNYQPENLISQIFTSSDYEGDAAQFADNLMAYLKYYNLDGFDIDWESPLSSWTTQDQFKYLINAIGDRFRQEKQHTGKKYYLTISPAVADHLDADAINNNVDFLNLQLYSGFTYPYKFTDVGINQNLLAYGAKFEAPYAGGPEDQGYEDAQHAYNTGTALGYTIFTNWRLNSTNFVFEQNQQKILYNLVH